MATTVETGQRTWTLAWRKPRANSFHRATNWEGTWAQAFELASAFGRENPGVQVWYVPSLDNERYERQEVEAGRLTDHGYSEDWGNVLVALGKRVRIRDNGRLSATVLAQVPDAAEAQARWEAGAL